MGPLIGLPVSSGPRQSNWLAGIPMRPWEVLESEAVQRRWLEAYDPHALVAMDDAMEHGREPCTAVVHGRLSQERIVLIRFPIGTCFYGRIVGVVFQPGRGPGVVVRDGHDVRNGWPGCSWFAGYPLYPYLCLPIRGARLGRLIQKPRTKR